MMRLVRLLQVLRQIACRYASTAFVTRTDSPDTAVKEVLPPPDTTCGAADLPLPGRPDATGEETSDAFAAQTICLCRCRFLDDDSLSSGNDIARRALHAPYASFFRRGDDGLGR